VLPYVKKLLIVTTVVASLVTLDLASSRAPTSAVGSGERLSVTTEIRHSPRKFGAFHEDLLLVEQSLAG
jgi:hypothetical protein